MRQDQWQALLRMMSIGVAASMLFASTKFSIDGFGIAVPSMKWLGVILSISIIGIEFVGNKDGFSHNLTMVAAWIASYVYGIGTNFIGIMFAMGNEWENPMSLFGAAFLAVFLEILPEPMIIWGLVGRSDEDLLSNLFGKINQQPQQQKPPQQNQQQQSQQKPPQQENRNGGNHPQQQPKQQQKPNRGPEQVFRPGNKPGPQNIMAVMQKIRAEEEHENE